MKKIAILSLALCPLLAGCTGHLLGSKVDHRSTQDHALSDVRSQLKKLRWRVSKLNKRVAAQKRQRSAYAPSAQGARATSESNVEKRFARLNAKLNQLAVSHNLVAATQTEIRDGLADDRAASRKKLDALEDKLRTIEVALTAQSTAAQAGTTPSSGAHDQAIVARLARLEAAIKAAGKKQKTLSDDLEKDRSLVIDYLEDLDSRLGKLEKSANAAPPAPSQKP